MSKFRSTASFGDFGEAVPCAWVNGDSNMNRLICSRACAAELWAQGMWGDHCLPKMSPYPFSTSPVRLLQQTQRDGRLSESSSLHSEGGEGSHILNIQTWTQPKEWMSMNGLWFTEKTVLEKYVMAKKSKCFFCPTLMYDMSPPPSEVPHHAPSSPSFCPL